MPSIAPFAKGQKCPRQRLVVRGYCLGQGWTAISVGRKTGPAEYDRRKVGTILRNAQLRQQGKGQDSRSVAGLSLHAALHGTFGRYRLKAGLGSRLSRFLLLLHHRITMVMVVNRSRPVAHEPTVHGHACTGPEWQRHREEKRHNCRDGGNAPHAEFNLYT